MSKQTKHILLAIGAAVVAYVIYAIYSAFKAGVTDLKSLAAAPFTAISDAYNGYTDAVNSAIDNNAPVVGNQVSAPLQTAGVTDDSAPDTQAQVTAFGNETADQKAAGVGTVSTWDVVKSWF